MLDLGRNGCRSLYRHALDRLEVLSGLGLELVPRHVLQMQVARGERFSVTSSALHTLLAFRVSDLDVLYRFIRYLEALRA